ncbi:MAG: hypothetical protein ACRD2W_21365 [Acidimicrobiales bacterium]
MRTGLRGPNAAAAGTIPYRVVVAGAELQLLILAADVGGCVGVDLDSGAFVRPSHPPVPTADLAVPFDIVAAEIAGSIEPPDASRPEALELAGTPEVIGQLLPRKAERLLAPLNHPPQLPLLGMPGNAVQYWTLAGESPSLALIEVRSDARLREGPFGPECHFVWQGADHELMLTDRRGLSAVAAFPRPTRGDVQQLLGYRPRRLLIMLTEPVQGYCHKSVAALLPAAR